MKKVFSMKSNSQTHFYFQLDFQKWNNIQEALVNPRDQTLQGQTVAKPGTHL